MGRDKKCNRVAKQIKSKEIIPGLEMDEDRMEEVAGLFREKLEGVLDDPEVVRRVLESSVSHRDVFIRRGEVWGEYLSGLEEHGVRRVGRLAHLALGSGGDEVVVADPFSESSLIVVPRDFAFRMVVLGGLP